LPRFLCSLEGLSWKKKRRRLNAAIRLRYHRSANAGSSTGGAHRHILRSYVPLPFSRAEGGLARRMWHYSPGRRSGFPSKRWNFCAISVPGSLSTFSQLCLVLLSSEHFPCSSGLPCRARSLLHPQMLAIMGPPKCGKSTLLSLTAGRGGTPRH